MAVSATDVQKAYLAYFGRPADPVGLGYWQNSDAATMKAGFAASAEYAALYSGMGIEARVSQVYSNLLGRSPDAAGLLYWSGEMAAGRQTVSSLVDAMQANALGADITTIANRVTYATAFTAAINETSEIVGYSGTAAANAARAAVALVKDDAASLTTATAAIATSVTTVVAGATSNEAATTYVLTTAQDTPVGTTADNVFRGVAGGAVGSQEQTTLNSSDIVDGAAGNDSLVVNLVGGNYAGGARIKNIETLQIGTNDTAAARTFDYNVNEGSNEVSEVTKIVYDQINGAESLTVQNVIKTNGTLPTFAWTNDSNTSAAGTAGITYRAAQVTGTTDGQAVELANVSAGTLNIARGIETITVTDKAASARNTLANSGAQDGAVNGADLTSETVGGNGTNSDSTLSKVVLNNTVAELGKAADVITSSSLAGYGLTDRAAAGAGDLGRAAGGSATTASNLLSVNATVKEVDATNATQAVNVRFTQRSDLASVDVTLKGGAGNDYVELQLGNDSVTGNAGNDTFAFLNNVYTNSTFGSTDTMAGGAGTDTIQFGVNGEGTYNINTTEFNNKTGFDVLDVRANRSTIALQDSFVAAGDAGTFSVRFDKVVQTSATDTANPTGSANNAVENDAQNTLDLTALADNRALNVTGGSGSERLVVNNASFNQYLSADLGANLNTAGTASAATDYDTITVVNTAVIDRGDLANIKGVEALVLAQSETTSQFSIEMTEAFMLNNTAALDTATTSIDDRSFRIGTAAAGNVNALNAGDTVTIDITDMLNAGRTALKSTLTGRGVDFASLTAAGVTVNWTIDGATFANGAGTAAQNASVVAATLADAARADAIGDAGLSTGAASGVTFTSGIGAVATLGTNNNDSFTLTQADTVTGGTGSDTVNLNAGSAAAVVTLGTGADTINVNTAIAATGAAVVNTAVASTINITVDQNGDLTEEILGGFAHTYNVSAAQTTLTVLNTAGATIAASAGGTFVLGAAGQIFIGTGATAQTVTTAAGVDTVTLNGTGNDIVNTSAGADTIALNSGADQVRFALTANAVNHQISGFTVGAGGDSLRFTDGGGAAFDLAGAATLLFASGTAAVVGAQSLNATNVNVVVVTGQAYAGYVTVEAAMNAAGRTEDDDQIVVFFNQTTNTAQVVLDTTAAAGGDTVVATLVGLTLADLGNITSANFAVV